VTLSTGFLAKGTIINQLGASYQQVSDAFALPATPIRHQRVDLFGQVERHAMDTNENGVRKYVS
jgi:hypothetical protein